MTAGYTEDQLTDWFPPDVKPVRPGVYRVRLLDGDTPGAGVIYEGFARFNGQHWSSRFDRVDHARIQLCGPEHFQNKPWRGLNFDPAPPQPGAKSALLQFAESISFSGPDDGGRWWMHAGVPGGLRIGVNLGREAGGVARAAPQLEQLRVQALIEGKR